MPKKKEEEDDIKIGMETLAKLLSNNIKLLLEISESHAKVTNEMKDRIDTLETQLISTNTNKDTRVDALSQSYGYQQIQTRSDLLCGSSSGPKRDAIIQSPKKIVIKGDSSPKKITINESHSKSIRIQPDDDECPLSPKEEEYKMVTKIIYELQTSDSYFISPGEHVYPRIIAMKNADPVMVKMIADHGFLDLIYPDKSLKEIENFDDIFKQEVSKFAWGRPIYLKFYTINPEVEDSIYYQAEHTITIGHSARNLKMDVGENDGHIPNFNRSWIRVIGYKVL